MPANGRRAKDTPITDTGVRLNVDMASPSRSLGNLGLWQSQAGSQKLAREAAGSQGAHVFLGLSLGLGDVNSFEMVLCRK